MLHRSLRRRMVLAMVVAALLVLALVPVRAGAGEPVTSELTLNDAINLALKHSLALRTAQLDIEKKEAERNYASDTVTFTPVMGGTGYSPAFELAWYGLLSADLTWQMSKKSYAATEDALVLQICQAYWDVLAAQQQTEVAELALKNAEAAAKNARLMAQVGLLAKADLANAEAQLKQTASNLDAAREALTGAYESFNQLVGLHPEDRPVLTEEPGYAPLEAASIEHEISRVLETSPAVWQAQQAQTLAQWNMNMLFATGRYQPYDARRAELQQAELSAVQAKDATEQLVRSLYNSLRTVEESYSALEQQLTMAQEKLRVAQVKFHAGMVTQADVLAAEMGVVQARKALDDLARQHAYLKLAFQKPWAMSGAGGTSAAGGISGGTSSGGAGGAGAGAR